jgi:hypothetical protein
MHKLKSILVSGRVVDEDGNLRVVYPSKTDLVQENGRIAVERA